jgi:hypothetical protein
VGVATATGVGDGDGAEAVGATDGDGAGAHPPSIARRLNAAIARRTLMILMT